MTLTNHDLSKLLAALRAGEMTDTIRTSLEWVLQALIEADTVSMPSSSGVRLRPAFSAAE